MRIGGMQIIESHLIKEVPRLKLSHDFTACSDEMRQHMDAWLLEKFGTYLPTYVLGDGSIVMHPKHIAMVKQQLLERGE